MKTNIDEYFANNQGKFDLAEPDAGHFDRFKARLESQDTDSKKGGSISYYLMAVAASVLLVFGFVLECIISVGFVDNGLWSWSIFLLFQLVNIKL